MNDKQRSYYEMYKRLENRLANNNTIVEAKPALVAGRNAIKARNRSIETTDNLATTPTKGITTDVGNLRTALEENCITLCSVLSPYAATVGNNTLYSEVFRQDSDIRGMDKEQLASYATLLSARATTNLANLADYGITEASITNFNTVAASYTANSQKPRAAVSDRKAAKADLKVQFKETLTWVKKVLDPLVKSTRKDHPNFAAQYFNDRIIVDPASPPPTPPTPPTS